MLTDAAMKERESLWSGSTAKRKELTLADPVFSNVIVVVIFGRWVVRSTARCTCVFTNSALTVSWDAPQHVDKSAESTRTSKCNRCILLILQMVTDYKSYPRLPRPVKLPAYRESLDFGWWGGSFTDADMVSVWNGRATFETWSGPPLPH